MGEASEGRRKGIDSFSLKTESYPRDLLHRFIFSTTQESEFIDAKEDDESEDIELNLGLSLGGRFGVDKNSKKLMRSSSINGAITIVRGDDGSNPPAVPFPALIRTSSLPTETEEWRKRKELQSLRRMEAKRRRSEKQRGKEERTEIEGLAAGNFGEKKGEENMVGLTADPHQPNWVASVAAAKQALFGGMVDVAKKGKGSILVGYSNGDRASRPVSQGFAESQGGSLSEMSELESKPLQGSNSNGEARSSSSNPMMQEQSDNEAGGSLKKKTIENSIKTSTEATNSVNSRGEDMPCVFTVGGGPNGRRVEGILYKYGKGEEVRIMCVCHGSFLSPAEFVKHAGGGDVANPLRHIVVNPRNSSFL